MAIWTHLWQDLFTHKRECLGSKDGEGVRYGEPVVSLRKWSTKPQEKTVLPHCSLLWWWSIEVFWLKPQPLIHHDMPHNSTFRSQWYSENWRVVFGNWRWYSETGIRKLEVVFGKLDSGIRKTGQWYSETGQWYSETGQWYSETGQWYSETGIRKTGSGIRKLESGIRKLGVVLGNWKKVFWILRAVSESDENSFWILRIVSEYHE